MKYEIKFREETGYSIDTTNGTTYWHVYEEVTAEEYYKRYSHWLEDNCDILAKQILSIHS